MGCRVVDGNCSAVDLGLCSVGTGELQMELGRGVVWSFEFPVDALRGGVEDECEEGSKIRYKNRVDTNCCSFMITEVGYEPGHYKSTKWEQMREMFREYRIQPLIYCKG